MVAPVVDDQLAVEVEARAIVGEQPERVQAGPGRRELAGPAHGKFILGQAWGRRSELPVEIHSGIHTNELGYSRALLPDEIFAQQPLPGVPGRRCQHGRGDRLQSVRRHLAGREVDPHLVAQGFAERIDQRNLACGRDMGAAAAAIHQPAPRTDHRDPPQLAAVERQGVVVVLEQHEARTRGLAIEGAVLEGVGGLGMLARVLVQFQCSDCAQLPPNHLVEKGGLDLILVEGAANRGWRVVHGLWHFKVQSRAHGRRRTVGRAPVGHEQATESPVALERLLEQARVLAGVDAVHAVVRAHHGPHPGLLHGGLERGQVDLVQRPRIDLGADRHAFGLLVVGGEVLDCSHHALALHSLDVGHGRARGEFRVFAVVLEVAATQRRARDVHRRAENHVLAVPLGLARDGCAHALDQRGIEGRG